MKKINRRDFLKLSALGGSAAALAACGTEATPEAEVEAPEAAVEAPELDLPFCLCWANENWTRRWAGKEKKVLIAQDYSAQDDLAFIAHIARYFDYRPTQFVVMVLVATLEGDFR